jgi:hypothetical protein
MRLLACLFLLLSRGLTRRASAGVAPRAPLEDVGLPFWSDLGYDWDERCWTDNGPYFGSASFGLPAHRARLVVSYSLPATGVVP